MSTININRKLIINVKGYSGDSIKVTSPFGATVTITDNAEITVKGEVTVRSNMSSIFIADNVINLGKNAIITTSGSGTNTSNARATLSMRATDSKKR